MHNDQLFVVTNKHVVSDVVDGQFVLRKATHHECKKLVVPGRGCSIHSAQASFVGHPSEAVGVAAMNTTQVVDELEGTTKPSRKVSTSHYVNAMPLFSLKEKCWSILKR